MELNIDKIWGAVCSGDLETLKIYYKSSCPKNLRYGRFGSDHSLIMGALRCGEFETAEFLKAQGETILLHEVDEYKKIMAVHVYEDEITKTANQL